jgi:SAM-dependent methyltransferase
MKKLVPLLLILFFTNVTQILPMESITNWFNENVFDWRERNWSPHFQKRLYKEPRDILTQALKIYETSPIQEKKALDLGAGAGNETAFLLQHGWQVWAEDKEKESIDIISNRTDVIPHKKNLTLIHASFTDIPWNKLPSFNLMCAIYALPFLDKNSFQKTWNNIINHVAPHGILAVTLFGTQHKVFGWWEARSMSFFTKEEISALFKGFDIKNFEESLEKNDDNVMEHIFTVIAQKK